MPSQSPALLAAMKLAVKANPKNKNGVWAVLYKDNNYGGKPLLIDDAGQTTMPNGWDDEATSAIAGPNAVFRLFHKAGYQSAHITLLPGEEISNLKLVGIHDGGSSYKLWDANALTPPY
ncbi:hypothetical protein PLANPX_5854 [Lacipirellula parvula]|uniref:Uncharacterized protein n=2 Tax=Lacipirellula parvula TaxID=2650471 RepID=A0A5K7XJG7_9BACT|nr:hypothetical protein PLANPX_5854 [Lacipirellula parvula]